MSLKWSFLDVAKALKLWLRAFPVVANLSATLWPVWPLISESWVAFGDLFLPMCHHFFREWTLPLRSGRQIHHCLSRLAFTFLKRQCWVGRLFIIKKRQNCSRYIEILLWKLFHQAAMAKKDWNNTGDFMASLKLLLFSSHYNKLISEFFPLWTQGRRPERVHFIYII